MDRLKSEKFVAGLKQSKKAIEAGKAKLVFIARDADMYVIFPIENLCETKNIKVEYVNNMKELAKACHVDVPTAIAAII